jgi:MFS family permease
MTAPVLGDGISVPSSLTRKLGPGAWVFVAEHVPARRYGFGIGTLTSGITGGILLGSLIALAVNTHYTQAEVTDFAWRIPFILGGVFGLVSVYLRRFLHETPVFQDRGSPQRGA